MNPFHQFARDIHALLVRMRDDGRLPAGLDLSRVTVEPPRDAAHGDLSTNAAMVLARPAGMPPRALAALLVDGLGGHPDIAGTEIAGPGFVNLRLVPRLWQAELGRILTAGTFYGDSRAGAGRAVNVEYVSANPTGPLTAGHARGAVVGDALAALLEKAGYAVTREYYINDAGAQVDVLARSAHLRYREALGETIAAIPPGLYPGEYLKEVGQALAARDGDRWAAVAESAWLPAVRDFAVATILDWIRDDLAALGVAPQVFTSERALVSAGAVEAVFTQLQAAGHIYVGVLEPPKGKTPEDWEPRPQTLFRATAFGDDLDRPLKKSDGSWTYFANDIAYHLDKVRRGCDDLIDIWGVDHGGYVKRMQAATAAVTGGRGRLDVKLCALVKMMQNGQPVKMSKRAGTFVTLRDVIDEVGRDVIRFIMLTRQNDKELEFDFAKVAEQSRDNPVFYVQYAHARCRSVLRHGATAFAEIDQTPSSLAGAAVERLDDPDEIALIRRLAEWPRQVEAAAEAHEPHRIAFYLQDLASGFHGLWNRGREDAALRFLHEDDPVLTRARLALIAAVATVIASGLRVMGVEPLEELRA
jgi:arginyl-tRNA synthetase